MAETGILIGLAQICVALAGFTSIVAALGNRNKGDWREIDLFRFENLLQTSLMGVVLGISPIIFLKMEASAEKAWQWTAVIGAVYFVVGFLRAILKVRKLPRNEISEISRLVASVSLIGTIGLGGLMTLNAIGLVYHGSPGPIILVIGWLIAFASFQFVLLLNVIRPNPG
jgi:hypothetical protein